MFTRHKYDYNQYCWVCLHVYSGITQSSVTVVTTERTPTSACTASCTCTCANVLIASAAVGCVASIVLLSFLAVIMVKLKKAMYQYTIITSAPLFHNYFYLLYSCRQTGKSNAFSTGMSLSVKVGLQGMEKRKLIGVQASFSTHRIDDYFRCRSKRWWWWWWCTWSRIYFGFLLHLWLWQYPTWLINYGFYFFCNLCRESLQERFVPREALATDFPAALNVSYEGGQNVAISHTSSDAYGLHNIPDQPNYEFIKQ